METILKRKLFIIVALAFFSWSNGPAEWLMRTQFDQYQLHSKQLSSTSYRTEVQFRSFFDTLKSRPFTTQWQVNATGSQGILSEDGRTLALCSEMVDPREISFDEQQVIQIYKRMGKTSQGSLIASIDAEKIIPFWGSESNSTAGNGYSGGNGTNWGSCFSVGKSSITLKISPNQKVTMEF